MTLPSKSPPKPGRAATPSADVGPAASSDFDIGERLRTIRNHHGLSQRELAKRAGVTNGTISLIEQNAVSPTIASLRKVLDGFPMSLADFFADDDEPAPTVFLRADDLPEIRIGEGLVLRQVGRARRDRRLLVLHEQYGPGGDTGAELLSHDGEEAGVVLRGRVEVSVGGKSQVLGPGDAYAFDSRLPHRFRNVGPEPAEIVSACAPPTF